VPSFRSGSVTELLEQRVGLQRFRVDLGGDEAERTYALTELTGPVEVGDEVVVNTTAVEWGLGTGGWHVLHWNLSRREWRQQGDGHIVKLRYTSLQADVGAAEEHLGAALPTRLPGTPVVACSVHSQVAAVAAAFAARRPGARLAYVMTDGASLPLALSDLVATLRAKDLLVGTVTAGHAFGGDLESVTVPSALLVAQHLLQADAVVVGMGPGVVGTGTRYGTTAVEVASILDGAAALGGTPILALRTSSGDPRERHRGVSHHAEMLLDLLRSPVLVADQPELDLVPDVARHRRVPVAAFDVGVAFEEHGLRVTTMGRTYDEDQGFFTSAGAAGALAAAVLAGEVRQAAGAPPADV
jgi:hypothetical protein